ILRHAGFRRILASRLDRKMTIHHKLVAPIAAAAILIACSSSSSGPRNTGPTTGTVTGTISSSQGGGIAGVTVLVTPPGGTPLASVVTDSAGKFQVLNVPIGTGDGRVSVSHLPAICASTTDSAAYASLTAGGTATANVTVPCSFAASGIVAWLAAE